MSKEPETAGDRMKREIHRTFGRIRVELDRIEILSVALAAFTKPVPDYEPGFQHMRHLTASALELKRG
ncbi:MAG TPA: hypothetical protein VIJ52_00615 [Pseudolabrys sp.]